METLLQGRYGHLLAVPCSADAFPQQHPSCLLSCPAQPSAHGVTFSSTYQQKR